jgi:hypothetical protein
MWIVQKPKKKTTRELFAAIQKALEERRYYFTDHGLERSRTRRKVNDLEVLRILRSSQKKHVAQKDKFERSQRDWNYHISGLNSDDESILIALSFDQAGMAIITVINLNEGDDE